MEGGTATGVGGLLLREKREEGEGLALGVEMFAFGTGAEVVMMRLGFRRTYM